MPTSAVVTQGGEHPCTPDAALVYCDLFGGSVVERVCLLLENELKAWWRGDVACRGCSRRWLR